MAMAGGMWALLTLCYILISITNCPFIIIIMFLLYYRQLSRLENKLSSDITMILNILQRQNGTARLRRSDPILSSPPPLDPLSTSDHSYSEHLPYVGRVDYRDVGCDRVDYRDVGCDRVDYRDVGSEREGEALEEESSDMQQLLCDEKLPEQVNYNAI